MSAPFNVSIVLYDTPEIHLKKCLNSLLKNINLNCLELIDNSSNDSLKFFEKYDDRIRYTNTKKNIGYGAGHNIALKRSIFTGISYHLVINADVYFNYKIINQMIDYLIINPNIGLISPKILFPDGRLQYLCKLCPSAIDLFLRRFASILNINNNNYELEMRWSGYNNIMFVPFLSGCFMLLNTKSLEKVGLFDERFFMYAEDIDFSRRIGVYFENIFFPSCTAYHEYQGESKKSLKMFIVHFVSLVKYFNKWGWFSDAERIKLNHKAKQVLLKCQINKVS